jgi:hypothetical protein
LLLKSRPRLATARIFEQPQIFARDVNHLKDSRQGHLPGNCYDSVNFGKVAPAVGPALAINRAFD